MCTSKSKVQCACCYIRTCAWWAQCLGLNAGLPAYLHSSRYFRKRLRQLNESHSPGGGCQTPAGSAPGAPGDPESDQRQEVEASIDALININQQQAAQCEKLHRHNGCCACTVDEEAAVQYLWSQKVRAFQLSQEIQAVDESIEAVRAAIADNAEHHHLRLESLAMRVQELENQYQPWREEVDQVSHATL